MSFFFFFFINASNNRYIHGSTEFDFITKLSYCSKLILVLLKEEKENNLQMRMISDNIVLVMIV